MLKTKESSQKGRTFSKRKKKLTYLLIKEGAHPELIHQWKQIESLIKLRKIAI